MARNLPTLHFDINVRLNEDSWGWHQPNISTDIDFNMPLAMFDPKIFATMVAEKVKELEKGYPQAVTKWEAEQEEERLRKEAEEEEGE